MTGGLLDLAGSPSPLLDRILGRLPARQLAEETTPDGGLKAKGSSQVTGLHGRLAAAQLCWFQ